LAALLPINGFALGLGEIEVKSFLNQPLNAEIAVTSARPGEIDDLLVSLASREAFSRAGMARPRNLTDLRFTVKKSEEGDTALILVTTRDAVKEPFLNFLVEADWSKGRLLREFTVLLDPPFYADQPPPAEPVSKESTAPVADDNVSMTEPSGSSEEMSEPATASETITEPIALSGEASDSQASSSPPASSEYATNESQNVIEGDVLVVKGDTLWSIASRYKDDDHSMSQVMLAFQRTNPNAFRDGNINNMKVGAVLRAPGASEYDALGKQAAYAEVLTQNGLWDEYVARVSGAPAGAVAEGGAQTSGTTDGAASQGELSLLMPAKGSSESSGTGDNADIDQLRTKLALAEEELDASRIENKELQSRIAELQARVSKFEELQKMVQIEDDSLAQIQAEQSTKKQADGTSQETPGASAQEPADDTGSDTKQSDEDKLLQELLAEEAAAQAEEQAALQKGNTPDGESDAAVSDEMAGDKTQAAASDDAMVDDTAKSTTMVAPPAPVIVTEPASSSPSMLDGILPQGVSDMIPSMDGILGDPIILAAIGGVIVLILILVIVKRKKAAQDSDSGISEVDDDDLFAGDDEEELTPIHLAEVEDQVQTDIKVSTTDDVAPENKTAAVEPEEDEFAATAIVSAVDMPEPESPAPAAAAAEQDDVLNEVDVYLAYGLYDNAEELLNSSLAEHPERGDYRSKLLDTYFATKNVNAFVTEAEKLKSMGDAARPYWDRVQIMGYELAPDNPLFSAAKDSGLSAADLEIAKPQEADFDLGSSDEDDTGFSTTDFNLGEEDTGGDFSESAALGEAGDLESTQQISESTQQISRVDDTSLDDIDTGDDDDMLELPDDIGDELEFSMDEEVAGEEDLVSDDLELPDDLEFDSGDEAASAASVADEAPQLPDELAMESADDDDLDFDMDAGIDDDLDLDDALELGSSEDDDIDQAKTSIITPNYEDTAVIPGKTDAAEDADDDAIDLGMEDTAMNVADEIVEETDESVLDAGEDDDDEDISIIDFGGEDFVEPTELIQSASDADEDTDDDAFVIDDEDGEETRTGTFAPGDFDEPAAKADSLDDIDDMDDLMLPDDVDEVSTKLDLARAFIDMGDTEGARGSLEEVMSEGNAEQKAEAKALLEQI
jgi:pilus assembly protein FimV